MARKFDSMARDARLNLVHGGWDIPFPVTGMTFPMVEYDRGVPVGIISYVNRDKPLPTGREAVCAHQMLGELWDGDGKELPFLTVRYDTRNWAFQIFPHNAAAVEILGTDRWLPCTELHFVRILYRMRDRVAPDLSRFGVSLSISEWLSHESPGLAEDWSGQAMSVRRRAYEPEGPMVRFDYRNPCADIDLAVMGDRSGMLGAVVEYKRGPAPDNPYAGHAYTFKALSGLHTAHHRTGPVPAFVAWYRTTDEPEWKFDVLCLNDSARLLLTGVMVSSRAVAPNWTPTELTYMHEALWVTLLEQASHS